MLIGDLIARRARSSPERVFWEQGGQRHTYAELDAEASRIARALIAEGLRPGTHAAICAGNGYAYLCAHYGAARAGLVLAHLSDRSTAAELAQLGAHCDAELLWFGPAQAAPVAAARAALPRVRRFVRLPGAAAEPLPPWAVEGSAWLAPHGCEPLADVAPAEDTAPFHLL